MNILLFIFDIGLLIAGADLLVRGGYFRQALRSVNNIARLPLHLPHLFMSPVK